MDIMNKFENGNNTAAKATPNQINPPLDEVIATIDLEMSLIGAPETDTEEKGQDSAKTDVSAQNQFILFALESNLFALPLSGALEVGHRPDITPLPNLPNWIAGISNIRGEIISLVNLKAFFGISSSGTKGERRFLIIHNQNMKVGIIVDAIPGILSLDRIDADIQNSPYRHGEIKNYVLGVSVSGDRLINILDTDRLLSSLSRTGFEEA